MRPIFRLGVVLLVLLLPVSVVLAKAVPDKVTVTGPGLAAPVEITDPEILAAANPWAGEFVDWGAAEITGTPPVEQRYETLVQLRGEDGRFRVIYAFEYAPDPSGGRGYIYLAGMDDEWYDVNVGTILRPTGWQRASAEWDAMMKSVLPASAASAGPGGFVPRGLLADESVVAAGLALAAAAGATAIWLFRRWGAARA